MAIAISEPVAEYSNTSNATSYALGAFTPTANSFLVCMVFCTGTVAAGSMSGGGLTWTRQQSILYNAVDTAYLFTAPVGSSPVSTTPTFSCTGDAGTGCVMMIFQFTGHNAANPIVQSDAEARTGANPVITLPGNMVTTNGYAAGFGMPRNPPTSTQPTNWSEIADTGYGSPTAGATGAYRAGGETGTTITFTSLSAAYGILAIEVRASLSHSLTASPVTTGAPSVATPALGQKHALVGSAATAGAPSVASPVVGQKHVLTAAVATTGAASVATPALGQSHALVAAGIATQAPVLETPLCEEESPSVDLTANPIIAGTPVVGSPVVGQQHVLTAQAATTGAASVAQAALGQVHITTADGVDLGNPVAQSPALGQQHAMTADGVNTGQPTLGGPVVGQGHALTAQEVLLGSPALSVPAIGQVHAMIADGVLAGAPLAAVSALGQIHALTAQNADLGIAILGGPTLGQAHALVGNGISAGVPAFGQPALGTEGEYNLAAVDLLTGAPICGSPVIGQHHALSAVGVILTVSGLGMPTLGQIHTLVGNGLVIGMPTIANPLIGIVDGKPVHIRIQITPVNDRTYRTHVRLTAYVSHATPTAYLWEFGDGETSTEAEPEHIYRLLKRYTIRLTVVYAGGSITTTRARMIRVRSMGVGSTRSIWLNSDR